MLYIRIKTTKITPGLKPVERQKGYTFKAVDTKVYREFRERKSKDGIKRIYTNIVYLVEKDGTLHLKTNCKKLQETTK